MIRGIHHTSIASRDLERLLQFYCGLLGLEKMVEYSWPRGTLAMDNIVGLKQTSGRVVFLKTTNTFLEMFQYESPTPGARDSVPRPCDPAITHICFDVVDVMGEYERLSAAGVPFHSPPQTHAGVCTVYARDPDGNIVEFQEILNPKSRMQLPGNRCDAASA
jgi:glyoxylase I family protein